MTLFLVITGVFSAQIVLASLLGHWLRSRSAGLEEAVDAMCQQMNADIRAVQAKRESGFSNAQPLRHAENPGLDPVFAGSLSAQQV